MYVLFRYNSWSVLAHDEILIMSFCWVLFGVWILQWRRTRILCFEKAGCACLSSLQGFSLVQLALCHMVLVLANGYLGCTLDVTCWWRGCNLAGGRLDLWSFLVLRRHLD